MAGKMGQLVPMGECRVEANGEEMMPVSKWGKRHVGEELVPVRACGRRPVGQMLAAVGAGGTCGVGRGIGSKRVSSTGGGQFEMDIIRFSTSYHMATEPKCHKDESITTQFRTVLLQ